MAAKRTRKRPASAPRERVEGDARPADAARDARYEPPSRGAQRRAELRKAQAARGGPAAWSGSGPTSGASTPAAEPVFWFGFEVSWAKLVLARFVLFALLAIDALLAIRHAPRYGAGGFNVAHLPLLDAIGPTRVTYEVGQLLLAYAFVHVALGVATRWLLPIATAIYGWLYFGSQLDSYQHHYLVFLILLIACFVPWQRPEAATPATRVRTWAVRLILVQLGIMYLWAAVSKMNPAWIDGSTLGRQLSGPLRWAIDHAAEVGHRISRSTIPVHPLAGIKVAAWFVIATELSLAVLVWIRPAWKFAAPVGIAFHAAILFSGLEIGLFAWLMLGIYILVVPDRIWVWLAAQLRLDRPRGPFLRSDRGALISAAVGIAIGVGVTLLCRFEHARVVGLLLAVVPIALVALARSRGALPSVAFAGVAHLIALALWVAVDRTSTVAVDYYRFWSASTRRLGDIETAERAIRRLIEIAPEDEVGHFQLGRLLLARNRSDEGLAELHEAERLEPLRARAFMEEASWLSGHDKKVEAVERAKEATYAEPENQAARNLLDNLTGAPGAAKPSAAAAAPPDDDIDSPAAPSTPP